jgi:hypothetical protein
LRDSHDENETSSGAPPALVLLDPRPSLAAGFPVISASPPASTLERDSVSSVGRPTHDDPPERKAYQVRMTPTVFVVLVLTIVILAFFAFFTLSLSLSGDPTPDPTYDTVTLEIKTAP